MNDFLALVARVRPEVELTLGPLIAIAMTTHVLLTKGEVKAAAGWVGLAWFSPFLGGLAYLLFGINRVQRRARRIRGDAVPVRGERRTPGPPGQDDHLEPLRRGVEFITGRQTESGCSFEIFHDGDGAYPAMLAAIEGARRSVGLSSYIMRDDRAGKLFVAALQAAHARGAQVRVVVDGIGSGWILSPVFWHLRRASVPVERFMHSALPWKMPFLNLRTHKKLLVVDGALAFTGGLNIAAQNVLADRPANPVQDTHFQVRGPVVRQLVEAFASDWAFLTGESLEGEAWFPTLDAAGDAVARVVTAGPDEDLEKVEFSAMQAIACARRSIRVLTPYFLPDQPVMTALSLAAMRGVAVDVVVPERSDNRMVEWAMRAHVGPLLHDGVRMWRSPPPFRHSKVLVVDGEWSLVGSSNWDTRSFRLNFELCVEVYDRALAEQLEALMLRCRGRPFDAAGLAARNLACRLRDSAVRLLLPYL